MWIGILIVSCSLLFFLLLWRQGNLKVLLEWLSIFWFRLAFAFLLLFVLNLVGSLVGLVIPVNFFSAITIALLGVPGVCSVSLINFFL